jgi:hypothetical protein
VSIIGPSTALLVAAAAFGLDLAEFFILGAITGAVCFWGSP